MFASYRVRELPSACGTMVKKTMHWSFAAQGDHFRNLQFIGEESGAADGVGVPGAGGPVAMLACS